MPRVPAKPWRAATSCDAVALGDAQWPVAAPWPCGDAMACVDATACGNVLACGARWRAAARLPAPTPPRAPGHPARLNAETTLVLIVSKTFTTAETMLNARTVKETPCSARRRRLRRRPVSAPGARRSRACAHERRGSERAWHGQRQSAQGMAHGQRRSGQRAAPGRRLSGAPVVFAQLRLGLVLGSAGVSFWCRPLGGPRPYTLVVALTTLGARGNLHSGSICRRRRRLGKTPASHRCPRNL